MNDTLLEELDNDSLAELLYELQNLDEECDDKIKEMMGDNNE